jgi:hypothetical protein
MIINPAEEVIDLTEDVDFLETKIEILESADEEGQDLSDLDLKALEIYTEINDLQIELLDYIEEEQGSIETAPLEEAE